MILSIFASPRKLPSYRTSAPLPLQASTKTHTDKNQRCASWVSEKTTCCNSPFEGIGLKVANRKPSEVLSKETHHLQQTRNLKPKKNSKKQPKPCFAYQKANTRSLSLSLSLQTKRNTKFQKGRGAGSLVFFRASSCNLYRRQAASNKATSSTIFPERQNFQQTHRAPKIFPQNSQNKERCTSSPKKAGYFSPSQATTS